MTLLIKNALCYIDDKIKKSDVLITDGFITEISSTISLNGADRVIDALDKYLLIPGFVDVHTHLREPGFSYKETIKSGAFSCVNDSNWYAAVADLSKRAAIDALNGWDPSGGAIYYFNASKTSDTFMHSRQVVKTIGNHKFCI